MRRRDKDLTLGKGDDGGDGGRRGSGGLDGQPRGAAEAELSLKNGAWPISKGQSPERQHTTFITAGCGLPV